MASPSPAGFPCSLVIDVPLPTHRLASVALQALRVDAELSPLVRRQLSLATPESVSGGGSGNGNGNSAQHEHHDSATVLHIEYAATTNRMLRVAVNGFLESLGLVLQVMEELDIDVLAAKRQALA